MTTYHNGGVYNSQPNNPFHQQIRIDDTKVRIPRCYRSRPHGVEQCPRTVADKVFNLCVCICGAHTRNGVVRPGWRSDEAPCGLDAFSEREDVELGREEASVDKRWVERVARVNGDAAAW